MANKKYWETNSVVNYFGLTDKEQMGIAFFISKGYTSGTIDGLHWRLVCNSICDDEMDMIVQLLEQGFTSGQCPTWHLTFERQNGLDREIEKMMQEHISEEGIELSEEQFKNALTGVLFWLNTTLNEAIADSFPHAKQ